MGDEHAEESRLQGGKYFRKCGHPIVNTSERFPRFLQSSQRITGNGNTGKLFTTANILENSTTFLFLYNYIRTSHKVTNQMSIAYVA
jgi:hypothetical protein